MNAPLLLQRHLSDRTVRTGSNTSPSLGGIRTDCTARDGRPCERHIEDNLFGLLA